MMMKLKMKAMLRVAVLAASSLVLGAAQGAAIVDQQQLEFSRAVGFSPASTGVIEPKGQSFTAGLNGYLDSVWLASNGDIHGGTNTVTLDIHDGEGVRGALLAHTTLTVAKGDGYEGLPFFEMSTKDLGVLVQSGHQYTFVITSVTGPGDLSSRGLLYNNGDVYAGGRSYLNSWSGYGSDFSFFTKVSPVPEPASYGMLLVGMGLIAGLARRRGAGR